MKHPAWQVYRDAASLCVTLGKELGLSPATRLRMHLPEAAEHDPDLHDVLTPRRLRDSDLD